MPSEGRETAPRRSGVVVGPESLAIWALWIVQLDPSTLALRVELDLRSRRLIAYQEALRVIVAHISMAGLVLESDVPHADLSSGPQTGCTSEVLLHQIPMAGLFSQPSGQPPKRAQGV